MDKMFQENKYYILKRKLEKYTLLQTITNFLNDHIKISLNRNDIIIINQELLILEADNENIKFRMAFENKEYSKPLKEIEKNYTSREIIDREYLDLEIQDNFQCKRNPNLISLHQVWEYEYQKKHLFALTGGKIRQIKIPSMTIENFFIDMNFISLLISLIFAYLIIINYNQIFNNINRNFSILFIIVGIYAFINYLNNYSLIKEYERELEYRIEKQRYE